LKVLPVSNGIPVDKAMTKKLLKFPAVHLSISFDATEKDLYENLRAGSNFDKIYGNLLDCIALRNTVGRDKFDVSITMLVQKENAHDIKNMLRVMHEHKIFLYFTPLYVLPIPASIAHFHNASQEITALRKAFNEAKEYFETICTEGDYEASFNSLMALEDLIPHHILKEEHKRVTGKIPKRFADRFIKEHSFEEKMYILFFPVKEGIAQPCQYYAPVDGFRYQAYLPEGKYALALSRFNEIIYPCLDWRTQVKKRTRELTYNSFVAVSINNAIKRIKGVLRTTLINIPITRKIVAFWRPAWR